MGRIRSIGIDWDAHGAVAYIDEDRSPIVYDMPSLEVRVGKTVRTVHDLISSANAIGEMIDKSAKKPGLK